MKTVLCFGDSNTHGYNPENGLRYDPEVRWTGRLQKILGSGYRIIEEGCNGRTANFVDPFEEWKTGLAYLKPCLNSHKPVDIMTLMLGSNDLKKWFNAEIEQIAEGIEKMIQTTCEFTKDKQGFVPEIILIAPPEIGQNISKSVFGNNFDKRAVEVSRKFAESYRKIADKYGCRFINAAEHVRPSEKDCLHLDASEHAKLAEIISRVILEIE